ncbi:MAG: nucleotidyltransferase family protein [Terracidiphilus sp.]
MTSASHLCGLILAAGESSRMGTDKALLPWPPPAAGSFAPPSQTLLSAAILALRPLTRAVVVVAGKNAEAIVPIIDASGAFLAYNPDPKRGQFSSLQVGLRDLLARGFDAAMITPVDCPPLSAASLQLLCTSFERALTRGLWAVAPENNGKHGHPLLVNRELIDTFLGAPVTSNAREVLRAHPQRTEYVPVPDALAKAGLNTPQDYAALAAKISEK